MSADNNLNRALAKRLVQRVATVNGTAIDPATVIGGITAATAVAGVALAAVGTATTTGTSLLALKDKGGPRLSIFEFRNEMFGLAEGEGLGAGLLVLTGWSSDDSSVSQVFSHLFPAGAEALAIEQGSSDDIDLELDLKVIVANGTEDPDSTKVTLQWHYDNGSGWKSTITIGSNSSKAGSYGKAQDVLVTTVNGVSYYITAFGGKSQGSVNMVQFWSVPSSVES